MHKELLAKKLNKSMKYEIIDSSNVYPSTASDPTIQFLFNLTEEKKIFLFPNKNVNQRYKVKSVFFCFVLGVKATL